MLDRRCDALLILCKGEQLDAVAHIGSASDHLGSQQRLQYALWAIADEGIGADQFYMFGHRAGVEDLLLLAGGQGLFAKEFRDMTAGGQHSLLHLLPAKDLQRTEIEVARPRIP